MHKLGWLLNPTFVFFLPTTSLSFFFLPAASMSGLCFFTLFSVFFVSERLAERGGFLRTGVSSGLKMDRFS